MKILIVEDELALSNSIYQYLRAEYTQCEQAHNYASARDKLEVYDYDCVILDIGLPDGSGLDLLSELKEDHKEEGVLIISAKSSIDDKVQGLRLGADDYLTKPFHLSELGARVAAIIRRKSFDGSNILEYDTLKMDLLQKTVTINGANIDLTRKEYDLLLYFIGNKSRVISKSALADHLWGDAINTDGYDFIYTHIKNLRKKLIQAGSPDYIRSVYGMGYQFKMP